MGAACTRSNQVEPQGSRYAVSASSLPDRPQPTPGGRSDLYLRTDSAGLTASTASAEEERSPHPVSSSRSSICSVESLHSTERGSRPLYARKGVRPSHTLAQRKKNTLAPAEQQPRDERRSLPSTTLAAQLRIAASPTPGDPGAGTFAAGAVGALGAGRKEPADEWQAAILRVMHRMDSETGSNADLQELCAMSEEAAQPKAAKTTSALRRLQQTGVLRAEGTY